MTPALHALLTLIDRLRSQHRAGIAPPAGEVESLFELTADVRSDIAMGRILFTPAQVAADEPVRARLFVEIADAAGHPIRHLPITLEVRS